MALVQIAHNALNAKLFTNDREIQVLVSKILSYQVEGFEQMNRFSAGHWDGRSSFFEFRKCLFPAGFVPLVQQHLSRKGHTVQVKRPELPKPLGPERPVFDEWAYSQPEYGYQLETVQKLERHGRLIAQIATGGGKSRIAKIAVGRLLRPTLFLTTRGVLMYQMRDHFNDLLQELPNHHPELDFLRKYSVGVLGDNVWNPRKLVNVGMVQTLISRLQEPDVFEDPAARLAQEARRAKTIRLLEMFECVILEEAHEASGNSYYGILEHCKNAHYRLALTATPFMKSDEEANMRLMACAGPIGIRVTEKQLIDNGILARPHFKFLRPQLPKGLYRTTRWPRCYEMGIVKSESRNRMVVEEAVRGAKHGLSVLVLVQRTAHGKLLEQAISKSGVKVKFLWGEHEQRERKAMLNKLAVGELQVLIGSTILDVGVDVPAIGMIILAGGGKAEVQLRQRIGRGLRAKKVGPNVAFVVDFDDFHNKILADHSGQRRSIIESTPGFAEQVLPPGRDFDFVGLGV